MRFLPYLALALGYSFMLAGAIGAAVGITFTLSAVVPVYRADIVGLRVPFMVLGLLVGGLLVMRGVQIVEDAHAAGPGATPTQR